MFLTRDIRRRLAIRFGRGNVKNVIDLSLDTEQQYVDGTICNIMVGMYILYSRQHRSYYRNVRELYTCLLDLNVF